MQQALNEYMRELAEEAQRNPDQQQQGMMQGQMMSGDQLQQMLDELQRLMEEGRTAEAAELMEQLRQLMQNMQVVQGQGGPMGELGQTLRDQQQLSDDAYRDMQEGRNGQQPEGQEGGEQQGDGQGQGSLAERQQELRNRLDQLQRGQLPGDGTAAGEEGRRNLDRA
ncbi:MAG: DUF4175 family protein, partial [Allosphingosinicella sp.]